MRRTEVNDHSLAGFVRAIRQWDHMLFSYHDRTNMQAEVSSPIGVYQVEEGMVLEKRNPMTEHEMVDVKGNEHVADF